MTEHGKKEELIFNFPQGLPGFEDLSEFRFLPEKEAPLALLTSAESEETGFILLRPEVYFPNYLQEIEIEDTADVLKAGMDTPIDVWVILKLCQQDLSKTTANLRAPLLFNPEKKLGLQYILNDDQYSSSTMVFPAKDTATLQKGAD